MKSTPPPVLPPTGTLSGSIVVLDESNPNGGYRGLPGWQSIFVGPISMAIRSSGRGDRRRWELHVHQCADGDLHPLGGHARLGYGIGETVGSLGGDYRQSDGRLHRSVFRFLIRTISMEMDTSSFTLSIAMPRR